MANNRMYLMHRPTGLAVYLGKHSGFGWHGVPDDMAPQMEDLFGQVQEQWLGEWSMEDFCVAMESCDADNNMVCDSWTTYKSAGNLAILGGVGVIPAAPEKTIEQRLAEARAVVSALSVCQSCCPPIQCSGESFSGRKDRQCACRSPKTLLCLAVIGLSPKMLEVAPANSYGQHAGRSLLTRQLIPGPLHCCALPAKGLGGFPRP